MTSIKLMPEELDVLIHRARLGWASGSIISESDFEFVEEVWMKYHLDSTLLASQIIRLKEIVLQLDDTMATIS